MGQTLNPTTTNSLAIPTSASPCLSPIRYSLDISSISQIQPANIDDEPIDTAHRSLPIDDGSMKVCDFLLQWKTRFILFSRYVLLKIFQPVEY
jgi:hypothetical protein